MTHKMGVVMDTGLFYSFAICHYAVCLAGSSATAELLVECCSHITLFVSLAQFTSVYTCCLAC